MEAPLATARGTDSTSFRCRIESMNDQNTPRLVRHFGTLQATALNMSNMIGIGPFLTIPLLMATLGGPQAMLGWLVALLIVIPDGMVWSELGAAMPGSGGSYIYLREGFGRESFGRLMAFLFIWQFIISGPLEIASGTSDSRNTWITSGRRLNPRR